MTFPSSGFTGLPAVRDMSGQWYAVMGIDRDEPARYASATAFAKAPADEAWVYSCVRRLYASAQGVPLRVYVRAGNELVPSADEPSPEGDDLQTLLDYVNPDEMTGADLKAYTVASYAVWGECYWSKVRGQLGGPPQELYWLRAPDIAIESDNGRTPKVYNHQPSGPNGFIGQKEAYRPRDIVPFRTPNLSNPMRGLSPLSAAGADISTGKTWADKVAIAAQNDSIPPGYWMIPKDAEFTKQDESLVRRTLRALRERRNKGRVPIMPTGIKFEGISLTPHDAEMIAQRKLSRMAVCGALGVPLVLAGDDEKTSVYANLRDAERVFWRGTMVPLLDGYADALNNWLVPDFDATRRRLLVAFDYSAIEALKPTLDVEWNMWLAAIYSQAVVPNEFRRHFRIGPDVPWGSRPIPRTAVAIRPDPSAIDAGALPGLMPELDAGLAESPDVVEDAAAVDALRAHGSALYRHPAIRAWIAAPDGELNVRALLGANVTDSTRTAIEAGLRRRASAAQIAESLSQGVPA